MRHTYVQIQKSQECAVSHSNVSILWDQCKRPWEIAAGVLQSHQEKYLLEKVERWSYIRTWFDRSVDQKCWFLAPKKHNFWWPLDKRGHSLSEKEVDSECRWSSWLWNEFKRFGQPDHFWLQQRITSLKHELLFTNEYPLVIISIFSFSYIKSSLRVSHEKSHSCNSRLWWENTIKNFVEKTPSQPLFTWFC